MIKLIGLSPFGQLAMASVLIKADSNSDFLNQAWVADFSL